MSKAGKRWKTISKMVIEIQYAHRAKCWRAISRIDKTEPMSFEETEPALLKLGGATYQINAFIRRRQHEDTDITSKV